MNAIAVQNWSESVKAMLEEVGYAFEEITSGSFNVPFAGKKVSFDVHVLVGDEATTKSTFLVAQARLPFVVANDKEKVSNLLDFLNRANCEIPVGNFELQMNSMRVVFRNGARINPGFNATQLQAMISTAVVSVDQSADGIFSLL